MGMKQVNLVFEGIDTVGEITINNEPAVFVDNMFVRHVIPFTPQSVSILPIASRVKNDGI